MQKADKLTEGTDMTPYALNNASSVALIPTEYGMAVEVTRKALDRIKYDGIAEIIDRLTYSMSLRIEGDIASLYNATVPGTSNSIQQLYANNTSSATITTTDTFNSALILDAVATMESKNNIPWPDGYYRLYISPFQYSELLKDPDTRQDLRFGAPDRLFTNEKGALHGCRIITTNYVQTTTEGASNNVTVYNAMLVAPRWAAIAWKRRPGTVVDPTLYDMGRRRRFGVLADYDTELLHAERALILKSA
jgi:N4-gp56 family major capsid protein